MVFRCWLAICAAGVLGSSVLLAQTPGDGTLVNIVPRLKPAPPEESGQPLLRVDSSLVLVPAHVTNALGASVTGLNRENFRVSEDGVEQTINAFFTEDAPLSIGILFDASGSMRPKMEKSAEAAQTFFQEANPQDEYFLIEFSDRARLVAPFTSDQKEIYNRIRAVRPFGRTSLLDAIYLALQQMKHARYSRKALVIVSDGGDNWSRHSRREVMNAVLESDVQIYAMGIFGPDRAGTPEERNGPQLLDDLSEQSGGWHFPVESLDELPAISERISRDLHSQYLLGYLSTNPVCDGKYRRVKVQLALPDTRAMHVSYRRGYYAPSE
jgi:Ca-activated chloride channel family protein